MVQHLKQSNQNASGWSANNVGKGVCACAYINKIKYTLYPAELLELDKRYILSLHNQNVKKQSSELD